MRSDSSTASSTSWVTITTVAPVLAMTPLSSSCSAARVSASSAPKGSSIKRIFGSMAKARAMPMRCFMPPEISCGYLCMACSMCTIASAASTRVFSLGLPSLRPNTCSTPSMTFSKQVIHGSSEWFWNTTARSGPGPGISRPSHSSTPVEGRVRPAIRLSSVLLPQPEWPISETTSPFLISRSMSRSAVKRPLLVLKDWPTLSILTSAFMGFSYRVS